jgi:hypothetical protein
MVALVVIGWAAAFVWPQLWLLALPALLPVVGLAPWTGWITFEELDILGLAVAAGGYARLAWSPPLNTASGTSRHHSSQSYLVLAWLLVGLFALSVAVAMARGFADAGGFSFGWFHGYHEPMNSVRLAKGLFLALLLLPLWLAQGRQDLERAQRLLSVGLMAGLGAAALATIWERAAFTGLLNFSSDYRTTGMFWEMHVGGAALDGFLALTFPFALRELVVARTPARWGLAAVGLGLGVYACLTTFSRGVYLAVPVGVLVFLVLTGRHGLPRYARNDEFPRTQWPPMLARLLLVAGFGAGAAWMFQSSGYRGMGALMATLALMLPLAPVLRGFKLTQWMLGLALGFMLVLLSMAIGWLVPKGAYVAWALAACFTVSMLVRLRRSARVTPLVAPLALAGFGATLVCTALVAMHWGDAAGLMHALPVVLAVLGVSVLAGASHQPLWPDSLRWQATTMGVMGLVAATLGVMAGGSYMSDRFTTGAQDLGGRQAHWQMGRSMLSSPSDWWLGKGLGRFPANYFLAGKVAQHPGDYRLKSEDDNNYLTLTGGLITNGWGEIFRVTQRVAEPGGTATVTALVRAAQDVRLHFEVCEKHLLYNQGCMVKEVGVKGAAGQWQALRVQLAGNATRGDWYAPRLLAFSMAMESRGGTADLDNVVLTSAEGRPLLANGDFSAGMAHWFFSSDRNHMPWHIKSMVMNVLFDQGVVGLALWGALLTGGLWRVSLGSARRHPLAPALAASLVGFFVVGLFDSLLDVPRVAWLYYWLVLVALTLPALHRHRGKP